MRKLGILAAIVAIVLICTNIYAADDAAPAKTADTTAKAPEKAEKVPVKKLTREEMIEKITDSLDDYPEIAQTIEGLESKKEADVVTYTFNKKKLTDLDDDTLTKLTSVIRRRASMENMRRLERQQKQLRTMQQVQQISQAQRITTPPTLPPAPPKVVIPPKPPEARK